MGDLVAEPVVIRYREMHAQTAVVRDAEIRYAERNGDNLAYTVFGAESHDLALMQSRTPIDLMWELPELAAFLEALGRLARVIVWDARGSGASDPVREVGRQPWCARCE